MFILPKTVYSILCEIERKEQKDGKVIMKYKGEIVEESEYALKVYHRDTFVGKSKEKSGKKWLIKKDPQMQALKGKRPLIPRRSSDAKAPGAR